MTKSYEAEKRYGRKDPREYLADPNKSPRTMDNFGSRSYEDIWKMTMKRSFGIWMTVFVVSALLLIIPALIVGPMVFAGFGICMIFFTAVILFVQAPLFWYSAKAYYKPEEYDNYN